MEKRIVPRYPTMNELRQTKEYQGSQEGRKYLDDLEKTKEEKLEKLDKEITKVFSPHKIPEEIKEIQKSKLKKLEEAHKMPEKIKEITLNEQIQEIAGIVAPTINDVIFNEIIEVMDNYDELNWGYFVQDDAPTALLDTCFEHKQEIHYKIFQLVLQKLK